MCKETDPADPADLAADVEAEEQKSAVMRTRQNSESRQARNPEVAQLYNSTYEDRMLKV